MANILFIYPRKMATTEEMYDVFTSTDAKRYGLNTRFVTIRDVSKKLLESTEIIVFVRNLDLLSQWILKEAHRRGIFIVQFFDDDILNLPRMSVNRVQFLPWRKKAIREGFNNTDVILSSNRMLAEKYAQMIPSGRFAVMDTIVSPNSLIPMSLRQDRYKDDIVKIVFAAGANHEEVFDGLISPILPTLVAQYGKKLSFTFYGVHPDLSSIEGKVDISFVGAMPLQEYRKSIQNGGYDIGLAPLEENDFTKYKYFNKFIEYTIAGIPGIYSKVLPYTIVVKDHENGFLAENTKEGWLAALEHAIEDVELRRYCYKNAYEYVLRNMNYESVFDKLLEDIPEFGKSNKESRIVRVMPIKTRYIVLRIIECIYLVTDHIKKAGISGTIKKINDYLQDGKVARSERLGVKG